MSNIVIFIDLLVMKLLTICSIITIKAYFAYGEFFGVIIPYTFIKSILGIVLLSKELICKNKPIHGKLYLLNLLPFSIIVFVPFIILLFLNLHYEFFHAIHPVTTQTHTHFVLMWLFFIILVIGLLMWLIYWTFYNSKIATLQIIALNILTTAYLIEFIRLIWRSL